MSEKYICNTGCEECGSSDGVGVYERQDGTYHGTCFVCEQHFNNIFDSPPDVSEFKEHVSMDEVNNASVNILKSRSISKQACEKYRVLSILDSKGDDLVHYYPNRSNGEVVGYVKRVVQGKKFTHIGDSKLLEFSGQKECGSHGKMVIVTEGVCDQLSAYDLLKRMGKNYRVCSVINGAGGGTSCFKQNYEWINTFDNIFLAFDQDEPGKKAAEKIANIFEPGKVKNISFSENDPNDMLKENKEQEFLQAIFNAKDGKPTGIVSVDDIFEEAIKPPVMGLSWPWETLTDATFGIRRAEIYGLGGASGGGKTEGLKEMINHTIYHHNLPAGVIFLEEPVAKTLKVLAGKKVNKRFHIPAERGGGWTIEELIDGINDLKGKVYLYNHFGSKDWDNIANKIRYMVISLGIKDIYLDHLTALVAQEDNEYKALNRIMEEMASLTQELDCTIYYISHLRKASGTPHEEGGRVTADQFKGSGSIIYWSNFLFGIERNQQAEDEDERNTTVFRVLKDRNSGIGTGVHFKLRYDHNTGKWNEFNGDQFDEEEFE